MKNEPMRYLKELGDLFFKVQVTGLDGTSWDLSAGMEEALRMILRQVSYHRKVMFIGNGGSAAISSHQAVDYWKNGGIPAIAFNDSSLLTCISNDFGYQHVFQKPIEMFADPGDILIAISSSGRSENILCGVQAARDKGCRIITMSGFDFNNPLRSTGHLNFYVPSHSYGYVEITHLCLCHYVVDSVMNEFK
jgi:D-sedoheptulose 7-phosphate isomerase